MGPENPAQLPITALAALLLAMLCGAPGCGEECVDDDDDGFGEGCEAGPDCDDQDPTRADDCEGGAGCEDPFE